MNLKNILKGFFVLMVVACAYSADTTTKAVPQTVLTTNSPVITNKSEEKSLKKQQTVNRPNTTWSKIKDLFM